VNGALRAANLRLLLESAPLREALALVAEVPLERLEAMSRGALCPDETAFHIERTLELPGKWLDGLNQTVPERTLELLKNPDRAGLHDDFEETSPALPAVVTLASRQPAPEVSAAPQPAPAPTQMSAHDTHALVADAAASARMDPSSIAAHTEGVEAAQGMVGPGPELGAPQMRARYGGSQTLTQHVARASRPAAATAELQLPLPTVATRSSSGPKEISPMASPELRKQNLSALLQGKGAKSALARVLQAKPPYVSALLSGRKALDEELCRDMARVLGLPDDWFEAPRTAADIPATTLQRLAPLRGDAETSASTAPGSDTAGAAASSGSGSSLADIAEDDTATGLPASEATPDKKRRRLTRGASQRGSQQTVERTELVAPSISAHSPAPVQADLLAPVGLEVQPPAQTPAVPALRTEVIAAAAPVAQALPAEPPVSAAADPAALQAVLVSPVLSPPLVIEGGLAPITEALIKILVLKARQGTLSEDKAFELLGEARLL
jgi:hypothetical protein